MKPLLAHIYDPARVTYPCYVQPKLNGIRALYQNGFFQSRDELPFTPGLLDHLAKPLKESFGPEVILDGELYVHGWPLQRINAAVTPVRSQPMEDTLKVEYHVFDAVALGKSFKERHFANQHIHQLYPIRWVQTVKIEDEQQANSWYAGFVESKHEGMMYRLGDCPYTFPKQPNPLKHHSRSKFLSDKDNRVWHLLKRKDWQDHEYECIAVTQGEGKYKGTLGALQCVAKIGNKLTGAAVFNVGSGLTDAQRDFYWRNPPIGKMIKVKYLCLSSDGIPLNPTVHPDHIIV